MSFYVGPFCRFIFLTSKLNAGGYNLSFKIELVSLWSFENIWSSPAVRNSPALPYKGEKSQASETPGSNWLRVWDLAC